MAARSRLPRELWRTFASHPEAVEAAKAAVRKYGGEFTVLEMRTTGTVSCCQPSFHPNPSYEPPVRY